jgi:hypothetical protein
MLLNTPRGHGMVIAPHHSRAGRYAEKVEIEVFYSFAKIANPSNSAKSKNPPQKIIRISRRQNHRFGARTIGRMEKISSVLVPQR